MNELLLDPLSHPDDLGKPIPQWPHATSVCMPRWVDNVEYEEGSLRVTDKLTCGYPRFVYHPFVKRLFTDCEKRFATHNERCVAFPSKKVAEQCYQFLKSNGSDSGLHEEGNYGIYCISFPENATKLVAYFWQHSGDGISSRQAYSVLENYPPSSDGVRAKQIIRKRIAEYVQCSPDHVYLFPSGMSAIFNTFRALKALNPSGKSVQFGFPYVDTLKVQEKFGEGVHFFPTGDEEDLKELDGLLASKNVIGTFCEFPMNPLLRSPNLAKLAQITKKYSIPLIVDDTISTFHNTQVIPPADVLVTSLTKFFSGVGDVMGGAVVITPDTPLRSTIFRKFQQEYEDNLWSEDAETLESNSKDFANRMIKINATAEMLCDYLHGHPQIEKLFYPKFVTRDEYDAFKKSEAGYSGVFSLIVRNSSRNTARFFDSLMISKGPSLGTNFSLACPYTILAHYHEIDFVEPCGVSKHLIRVSVGLEEPSDLIARFDHALSACKQLK